MAMADHNGPEEQTDDHWQVRDDEDTVEAKRTRAAAILEQIACQVREALRAEDIGTPVFFVIPNGLGPGDSQFRYTRRSPRRRMGARERNRDIHCRSVARIA